MDEYDYNHKGGFDMSQADFVETLYNAYKNVVATEKSIFPADIDLEEAYRIQHSFTEAKKENNESLKGYKISMTSPETQALFDATEPLYGQMTDKQVAGTVSMARDMLSPLVELELVFVIKEELTAASTTEEIVAKTQVAPGLEVPDSRFMDWFPKMPKEQVCADGAVGGKVVFGEAKDFAYKDLDDINGKLILNGTVLDQGSSNTVMGHPVLAVKWLLEKLGQHDLTLKPGMFVSSGTFVLPKQLEEGEYVGEFEGIGSVQLNVTA